jgi:hypothetical protein
VATAHSSNRVANSNGIDNRSFTRFILKVPPNFAVRQQGYGDEVHPILPSCQENFGRKEGFGDVNICVGPG